MRKPFTLNSCNFKPKYTHKSDKLLNYKTYLGFMSLANWRKKEAVLYLKNRIKQQQTKFNDNRLFFSYEYINKDHKVCWGDFYFPSKLYNNIRYDAFIYSAQYAMHENIYWEIFNNIYDETKNYAEDEMKFIPDKNNKFKPKCKRTYRSEMNYINIDKFDGRTRAEELEYRFNNWFVNNKDSYIIYSYIQLHSGDITTVKTPETFKKYQLHDYYKYHHKKLINYNKFPQKIKNKKDINKLYISHYNVVINAVIPNPTFGVEEVNNLINFFYNNGETSWISETPIEQNNLIYDVKWPDKLECGLANAIITD